MSVSEESIPDLVHRLVRGGVSFRAEEGRLYAKPPPGGGMEESDLEAVRTGKAAVLDHLARADAAVAETLDLLEWARRKYGRTPGVQVVAEEYAHATRACRERLDPLVLDAPATVRAWLSRLAETVVNPFDARLGRRPR